MTSSSTEIDARIESCQGLVRSLAHTIHRRFNGMVDLQDLVGYGQVGLSQAAHEFDVSRNVQFSTYAYYRIRGAIYDGAGKMAGRSYAARRDAHWNNVLQEDVNGSEEPESNTGHWLTSVTSQMATAAVLQLSSSPAADVADDDAERPLSALCSEELRSRLHELIDELPEESATLIRATYFNGLTLQDAAVQLGISKSWASRLHAKTLKWLADRLRAGGYDSE